MLDIFVKVLLIMLVLFLFMVPGYILQRKKMVGEGGLKTLSNILLYVCQPALCISAFCVFKSNQEYLQILELGELTLLKNFGLVAIISVCAIFIMFLISKLVFIKEKDRSRANVYSYVAIFSNCGFLGVPFIQMFTDGNAFAVMYIMAFSIVFNILCWSLGVYLITGDLKKIRIKKLILNPCIISCVLSIILFFFPSVNIFMFEDIKEVQMIPSYLGYMTAPLSMMIVGIRVAQIPLKHLFSDWKSYIAGFLRLLVAPLITLVCSLPFMFIIEKGVNYAEYIYLAPIIAMAMSPAAAVVAMSETFEGDSKTASIAFVLNTLLSIVTIPIMITLIMSIV